MFPLTHLSLSRFCELTQIFFTGVRVDRSSFSGSGAPRSFYGTRPLDVTMLEVLMFKICPQTISYSKHEIRYTLSTLGAAKSVVLCRPIIDNHFFLSRRLIVSIKNCGCLQERNKCWENQLITRHLFNCSNFDDKQCRAINTALIRKRQARLGHCSSGSIHL